MEYEISSTQLITEEMTNIPGLKITMDQQPIKNLTSTTIKFTNTGNQTILSSDFAAIDPLGVAVNGQFLNITNGCMVKTNSPNASPSLKVLNDFTMGIEFDFLKPKRSLYITLLHNGKIAPTGELKDGTMREHVNIPRYLIARASILSSFATILSTYILTEFFYFLDFDKRVLPRSIWEICTFGVLIIIIFRLCYVLSTEHNAKKK